MSFHEELADFLLTTLAGQLSGMNREQLIEHLRKQEPNEDVLRQQHQATLQQANTIVDQVNAMLEQRQQGPTSPSFAPRRLH